MVINHGDGRKHSAVKRPVDGPGVGNLVCSNFSSSRASTKVVQYGPLNMLVNEKRQITSLRHIGKHVPEKLMLRVIFEAMDDKTNDDAEREGLDNLSTKYDDIKALIRLTTREG